MGRSLSLQTTDVKVIEGLNEHKSILLDYQF